IIGHSEVPDPNHPGQFGGAGHHTDPGQYWDWTKYMNLVRTYAGSSAPAPQPSPSPSPSHGKTYVVQKGDTLSGIAQKEGVSLQALIAANPQISNPNLIYPG